MKNTELKNITNSQEMPASIAVLSFYAFVKIEDPEILLPKILLITKKKYVKGTIIIAREGFNGSICGKKENLDLVIEELRNLTKASDINVKVNYCDKGPFFKIKVKIKREIVSLRHGDIDVETLKGEYIESKDWDRFIQRKDVVLVDTRNTYEIKAGTFVGAVDPKTANFRDFPRWVETNRDLFKDKKIAMYCTGGIRCEKSTAYMRSLGYNEVFHLKGGILQYFEDTANKNGIWKGDCFVFDQRGAVNADLSPAEGYWVGEGQTAKGVSITYCKTELT